MRSVAVAGVVVLCSLSGLVGEVRAQERIFDPENPGIEEQEETPRSTGRESIVDPENVGDEERDPFPLPDPVRSVPTEFQRTSWGLSYEMGVLSDAWIKPRGRDAWEFVGGLGMELSHEISEETRLVMSGRVRYWSAAGPGFDDWRSEVETGLDRAYVVHRPGRWSFSAGQMRNRWGSTDLVRPGDVIDPSDMGSGGPGETLAQLAAVVGYSGNSFGLRLVVVPFFTPNRVALFGSDRALANSNNPLVAEQLPFLSLAEELLDPSVYPQGQEFFQATRRPQPLPKNGSLGLRGTWTVGGTDLGLGGFYGWDRTPWVTLDEDMAALLTLIAEDGQIFEDYDFFGFVGRNPEALAISQRLSDKAADGEELFATEFRRRATFLLDGARYIGPIGVRADVAFSPQRVLYTTDFQPRQLPATFAALGLSYERLLDGVRPLSLTVEGFHFLAYGGEEDEELLLVEGGYYGVAGAVNWHTGLWDLELQGGAMVSISPGDVVGRAQVSRRFTPGVRVTVGGHLFWGPDPEEVLSPGGIWATNDRVFVMVGGEL